MCQLLILVFALESADSLLFLRRIDLLFTLLWIIVSSSSVVGFSEEKGICGLLGFFSFSWGNIAVRKEYL